MNPNKATEERAGDGHHTCTPAGKRIYVTRKNARRARRRFGDGHELNIYPCPHGDHYHIGHLPPAVRRGQYDKREWLDRKTRRQA